MDAANNKSIENMTFISYAQNFEDVMLWRALKHVDNGFYIDVGAHDPEAGSVTKAFYDRKWRGINIEPITTPFKALSLERTRDINVQCCIGASEGSIAIYDIQPSGLATVIPDIAEMHRAAGLMVHKITVPMHRLEVICREHVHGDIHFLKIDVEGYERDALAGMDFSLFRPWIVVVEATIPNSSTPSYQEWETLLIDARYGFVYFDGLNRYYVAAEHPELIPSFAVPPNYFDNFALAPSTFFAREVFAQVKKAEAAASQAEAEVASMLNSKSWKITAPLRKASVMVKSLRVDMAAAKKKMVINVKTVPRHVASFILSRPWLKRLSLLMLNRFPKIKVHLAKVVNMQLSLPQQPALPYIKSKIKLSRPAMRTYRDLLDELHMSQNNK